MQALDKIVPGGSEGLVVSNMASLGDRSSTIITTVASRGIPTIYPGSLWVSYGGLMSYAPDFDSVLHQETAQIDKILRGARPADIPVERPRSFECGLNRRTTERLGLSIPPSVDAVVTRWVP